jgi:probable HAF family extracellular repeat protein
MLDLGSLGGTLGNPTAFNNRGEVVGISNLAGDLASHPFLWTSSRGMQDLGTLGGDAGVTNWINDSGVIAGKADLPGPPPQNHDAVLWKNGAIIDLGTVTGDSCANAYCVNASGQVVGASEDQEFCLIPTGQHAFLWENGGPMVDLNTLIPPGSSLQLTFAVAINNRGEIVGFGVPAGCAPQDYDLCGHAYVLIPCDDEHGAGGRCRDGGVSAPQVTPVSVTPELRTATPHTPVLNNRVAPFRAHPFPGYRTPGGGLSEKKFKRNTGPGRARPIRQAVAPAQPSAAAQA